MEGQRSSLWHGQREGSVSYATLQITTIYFYRLLREGCWRNQILGSWGTPRSHHWPLPFFGNTIVHSWPIRGHWSMQQHWKRLSSPPQRGSLPKTGQFLEFGPRKWPRGVCRLDYTLIDPCDKTAFQLHPLGVSRCDKAALRRKSNHLS